MQKRSIYRTRDPIILARAAHLIAFTDVLDKLGAPIYGKHRIYALPDFELVQPDMYVPVRPALSFLERMERDEGIDDLGFLASRQDRFQHLSDEFLRISRSAPTLFSRLCHFSRLVPIENTHCRVALSREGNDFRVSANVVGCQLIHGLRYSEWIQIGVLIDLVRKSVSPDWQPAEITFQSRFMPAASVFEQFPNTRILVGRENTSIKVPVALMTKPSEYAHPGQGCLAIEPSGHATDPEKDMCFPQALKLALRAYLREGYPDIELAAEISGVSVRTLQRRLAEFGLSYSTLVRELRIEVALDLLKDQRIKAFEVAYEVGYSDPSNFARAFRQIAGVSPEEYRHRQNPN